jgi:hypothetical protein
MQRDGPSIDHDSLPLRVVRFKNEEDAILATKCQLPRRDGEYFRKPKDVAIEMFRFVQVIHVQGGFQDAIESGWSSVSHG